MRYKTKIRELTVFALSATIMLLGKVIFEPLPNVHPLGALIMTYTLVFRKKALVPIYLYVFLQGLIAGFNLWWIPYLYIWTFLWGATMLLPKKLPVPYVIYPIVCALHGLAFGTLYAPAQALLFHLNFKQMLVWIAAGFPFDITHAIGNFAAGFLVFPLVAVLKKLERR
jgi:energy-coupling factor transport system substrate-specific component